MLAHDHMTPRPINAIGGLPGVDERANVVGVVTETDIVNPFVCMYDAASAASAQL